MNLQRKRHTVPDSDTEKHASAVEREARLSKRSSGFPWKASLLGIMTGALAVYLFWQFTPGSPPVTKRPSDVDTVASQVEPPLQQRRNARRSPRTTRRELRQQTQTRSSSSSSELPLRSDREIRAKLVSNRQAYGGCYLAGLANDPNIEGTVVLRFHIESDGRVSQVTIKSSTLNSPVVEDCLKRVIAQWRFQSGRRAEDFELDFPFTRQ